MAVWSIVSSKVTHRRLDPEYYQPFNLDLERQLAKASPQSVQEFAFVTDGIHGSPEWVDSGGIRYLSAKSVKGNGIVPDDGGRISLEQHQANPRTEARAGDVLLTTVGTIGNAAVVEPEDLPANMDRHLGIIRVHDHSKVDPYYLSAFLNSRYGRFQTIREATGNVQLNLFIYAVSDLLVPTGSSYNAIGEAVRDAYQLRAEAKHIYADAEALLTDALGLDALTLPTPTTYTARFSDTARAERFDSGYFHPEKRAMLAHLARHGALPLGHYVRSVRDAVQPAAQDPAAPVRNFDLPDALRFYLSDDTPAATFADLGSTKKAMQPGDVACSRLRFYLKETAVVRTESPLPVVGSSEFYVFRPVPGAGLRAEALVVLLRSRAAQTIAKWCQSGSAHPRVDESDLLSIPIPPALLGVQDQIADLLDASIALDRDAARLLAEATARVEALVLAA